jgi:hypothetical protein
MRAYFFCNFYLSSIQQGIQAAHCLAEMFVEHPIGLTGHRLHRWAQEHKTLIVLNGGNNEELCNKYAELRRLCEVLGYPHAMFIEDTASLNNAATCIGVVVPEPIYVYNEYEQKLRKPTPGGTMFDAYQLNPVTLNTEEKAIADIIAAAPLAR